MRPLRCTSAPQHRPHWLLRQRGLTTAKRQCSEQQVTQNRGGVATCSARSKLAVQEQDPISEEGTQELAEYSKEIFSRLEGSLHEPAPRAAAQEKRKNIKTAASSQTSRERERRSSVLSGDVFAAGTSPSAVLTKLQPSDKELIRLMTHLVQREEHRRAGQVLDWILEQPQFKDMGPQFCSRLIMQLGKAPSGARHALELHQRMQRESIPMDLISYNTVINALGKARKWQQVLDVFAEMQECGVKPDVFTYSSLIKACQNCGNRWMQALDFLDQMKRDGVKPNVITYTTLISCCQRAGRWRQAMAAFREMEESGVQADVKAYNSVMSACAKGGRWENAWEVLAGMRRVGMRPSARSYNALLSACDRARQPQRALEVYRRMLRDAEGAGPEQQPTLITYNTLISACAKGGMLDTTEALLADMEARRLTPDVFTLSALIRGCKQLGRWEQALEIVEEFQSRHGVRLNTVACNALLAALGCAGRWQYALQYFEQLEAGQLDGRADGWSYSATVLALRAGGQHRRVLDMYHRMQAGGFPIYKDVYPAALEACERLGLWKEGHQVLLDMQADESAKGFLDSGLDVAAWQAVFAFPPLMESVPKPFISAARAAVDSGRFARRFVSAKREKPASEGEQEED